MGLLRPNGFEIDSVWNLIFWTATIFFVIILNVIFTPVFGGSLNFWKNYSKTIFDKKKLRTLNMKH